MRVIVSVAGFEPTTSTTPKWRATGLRYTLISLERGRKLAMFAGNHGTTQPATWPVAVVMTAVSGPVLAGVDGRVIRVSPAGRSMMLWA